MASTITKSDIGSVCTIKTMQNETLFKGQITNLGDDYVDVSDPNGEHIPLFAFDVQVKIEIPGGAGKFKILTGKTYISSREFLRISGPTTMSDFDNRLYFRIKWSNSIQIFVPSESDPQDTDKDEIFDATAVDLSLGGIQFKSDKRYKEGDKIFVTINILGRDMFLSTKIRRCYLNEKDKLFYCGGEFLQITEKQQDFIYKYLLQLEMEERRKMNEKKNK